MLLFLWLRCQLCEKMGQQMSGIAALHFAIAGKSIRVVGKVRCFFFVFLKKSGRKQFPVLRKEGSFFFGVTGRCFRLCAVFFLDIYRYAFVDRDIFHREVIIVISATLRRAERKAQTDRSPDAGKDRLFGRITGLETGVRSFPGSKALWRVCRPHRCRRVELRR